MLSCGVECKSIVVWVVFEFGACLFAEYVSGFGNAWAVAVDVMCVVWTLAAHVTGVWIVGGASGWDV